MIFSAIEIGPGRGALTKHLVDVYTNLHLVELDKRLIPKLAKSYPQAHLHQADALNLIKVRCRVTMWPVSEIYHMKYHPVYCFYYASTHRLRSATLWYSMSLHCVHLA